MLPGLLKGLEYKLEQARDNIFELKKCFSNIMRDKIGSASKSREEAFYLLTNAGEQKNSSSSPAFVVIDNG